MTFDREKKIKDNHKNALTLLTLNYDLKEKKNYFKIEEKKAYWNAVEKPLYDLKNKINAWIKEERKIIIYGTFDHTKLLIDNVDDFLDLNILGFTPYTNINDDYNNLERHKFPFTEFKNLSEKYDDKTVIFISSYEFAYDIEKKLKEEFPSAEYYKPYTGYTRNLSYNFKKKN